MALIHPVATALPEHRLPQAELRAVAETVIPEGPGKRDILDVFDNGGIQQRALAMPIPWYLEPHGFKDRTAAYVDAGMRLVQEAAEGALREAGLPPAALDAVVLVSTTGLATPSLEARLANRLRLRSDVVRVPVWGLGCAGGVAGLNRGVELAERTRGNVLVVALELCSLSFDIAKTLAPKGGNPDKKSMVAASLFADGCAATIVSAAGEAREARTREGAVTHVAGASHLFAATERVMGWDVEDHNLDVVLSPRIPAIVEAEMAAVVGPFLHRHLGGRPPDHWVLHPGGAKVIEAYRTALGLDAAQLRWSHEALRQYGNMSSPTVLFAMRQWMDEARPEPGQTALLGALGPGFAAELALVRA